MNRVFATAIIAMLVVGTLSVDRIQARELSPQGHFNIERPAILDAVSAERIYQQMLPTLRNGYKLADYGFAKQYTRWHRYNHSPYLSAGHGNRFLNNYGNRLAVNYLKLAAGQKMPAGAVLAKDSFTATNGNKQHPGALFAMEKLQQGSAPEYGDWRYIMIMPDGSLLGDSGKADDRSMKFCHSCHQANAEYDFLFGIPDQYAKSED